MGKDRDWLAIFVISITFLLGPGIAVGVYRLIESLEQSTKQVVAGMVIATIFFVMITLCLSLFVVVYSKLRRTEEHEDDYREMALINQVKSIYGRGDSPPVTVQVAPGIGLPQPGGPNQYTPPQLDYQKGVDIG